MRPVKQSKLYSPEGNHSGNCFAACMASLLDLPLWMVPPFEEMFGRADFGVQKHATLWLDRVFGLQLVRSNQHEPDRLPEFYIACGPSPRGVFHSVIFSKGAMVHDPHFSDAGISSVEWVWYLAPAEPRT